MFGNADVCLQLRRHNVWCISDEQYIGTLLGWKLGDRSENEFLNDDAMVKVAAGDGYPADAVSAELIMQIRTSSTNLSEYHGPLVEFQGECHAVEK